MLSVLVLAADVLGQHCPGVQIAQRLLVQLAGERDDLDPGDLVPSPTRALRNPAMAVASASSVNAQLA